MSMAKKQQQHAKTCADCIHESACRVWTDGRAISDASASQCPNHETVKESGAYLCGVLDERKRKQTNGDRIRAMSDEELAKHFSGMICDINEGVEYHENPNRWLEWLKQPVEEELCLK